MGTISEKLNYLYKTKDKIKEALNEKGANISDTDTFRSYADKIAKLAGVGGVQECVFNYRTHLNVSDSCFDLTENISGQIIPYLPLFNYEYFAGFSPLFKNYVCDLNGTTYTNSTSSSYLTMSNTVIRFVNSSRNKRLIFTNPIYNSKYTTLNLRAAVPQYTSGAWNTCCIMVSRAIDTSSITRFDGSGQSDIVAHKHFTNYTDSSYPNTVEEQTFSLDISDSIGSNIYIGFHSCSNEFDIYSLYLTE